MGSKKWNVMGNLCNCFSFSGRNNGDNGILVLQMMGHNALHSYQEISTLYFAYISNVYGSVLKEY